MICLSLTSRARLPPRSGPDRLSPSLPPPPHHTTSTTTIPQPRLFTASSSSSRLQPILLTLSLPSARIHYTYWITFPLPKKCFRLDDCLLFFHHTTTRTLPPPICHYTNLTDIPATHPKHFSFCFSTAFVFPGLFPATTLHTSTTVITTLPIYTHTLISHSLLSLNHSVYEILRKTFELYTKTYKNNNIFNASYDIGSISLKLFFVSPQKVTSDVIYVI